ncbi:hypothetical protein P7C70_g1233, partial [Phenoliferia sp. Uapishka_3]
MYVESGLTHGSHYVLAPALIPANFFYRIIATPPTRKAPRESLKEDTTLQPPPVTRLARRRHTISGGVVRVVTDDAQDDSGSREQVSSLTDEVLSPESPRERSVDLNITPPAAKAPVDENEETPRPHRFYPDPRFRIQDSPPLSYPGSTYSSSASSDGYQPSSRTSSAQWDFTGSFGEAFAYQGHPEPQYPYILPPLPWRHPSYYGMFDITSTPLSSWPPSYPLSYPPSALSNDFSDHKSNFYEPFPFSPTLGNFFNSPSRYKGFGTPPSPPEFHLPSFSHQLFQYANLAPSTQFYPPETDSSLSAAEDAKKLLKSVVQQHLDGGAVIRRTGRAKFFDLQRYLFITQLSSWAKDSVASPRTKLYENQLSPHAAQPDTPQPPQVEYDLVKTTNGGYQALNVQGAGEYNIRYREAWAMPWAMPGKALRMLPCNIKSCPPVRALALSSLLWKRAQSPPPTSFHILSPTYALNDQHAAQRKREKGARSRRDYFVDSPDNSLITSFNISCVGLLSSLQNTTTTSPPRGKKAQNASKAPAAKKAKEPAAKKRRAHDGSTHSSSDLDPAEEESSDEEEEEEEPEIEEGPLMLAAEAESADNEVSPDEELEEMTQAARVLNLKANHRAGKVDPYPRQIKRWDAFWVTYRTPSGGTLADRPITAAKAYIFLSAESERAHVKSKKGGGGEDIEGTSLGVSALAQALNALEQERVYTAHRYRDITAAQIQLRSDARIRALQDGWKRKTSARVRKSQTLKAGGASAERITMEERLALDKHWLHAHSATQLAHLGGDLRDRSMFHKGSATAQRGDNERLILLSDLSVIDHPVNGRSSSVPLFVIASDNSKTNTTGRVDQTGVWRHKDPALCGVGTTATQLWFCDEHLKFPRPDFAPDFSEAAKADGFGKFGRRPWYERVLNTGKTTAGLSVQNQCKPMAYTTHNAAYKRAFAACDISASKTTHICRRLAASNAALNGADKTDTKSHGLWKAGAGSYKDYEREFPMSTIAALAGGNGQCPEEYFVARTEIAPPPELLKLIFPWVDEERKAYLERLRVNPLAKDIALVNYLEVLEWFRSVILQDGAVLRARNPKAALFQLAPFNSPEFDFFAKEFVLDVQRVEETHEANLLHVPTLLARLVQASITGSMAQARAHFVSLTDSMASGQLEMREGFGRMVTGAADGGRNRGWKEEYERQNADLRCRNEELSRQVEELTHQLEFFQLQAPTGTAGVGAEASRTSRSALGFFVTRPHIFDSRFPASANFTDSPPAELGSQHDPASLRASAHLSVSGNQSNSPPNPAPSSADVARMHEQLAALNARISTHPDRPTTPRHSPHQQLNHDSSSPPVSVAHNSPTFSQAPDGSPARDPSAPFVFHAPAPPSRPVPQPFVFPPPPGVPAFPLTGYTSQLPLDIERGVARTLLAQTARFGNDNLRVRKLRETVALWGSRLEGMEVKWVMTKPGGCDGLWCPVYSLAVAPETAQAVWLEWEEGVAGQLSTSDMERGWKVEWRKGSTNASYWSRRKTVINLIEELQKTHNWASKDVLRFLQTQYNLLNARQLCELVSKVDKTSGLKEGRLTLMAAALRWKP